MEPTYYRLEHHTQLALRMKGIVMTAILKENMITS
jgi:hypothetical protein